MPLRSEKRSVRATSFPLLNATMGFVLKFLTVAAAVLAIVMLQLETSTLQGDIAIVSQSDLIDKHLAPFKPQLGDDYNGYRNHLLRVYSYTQHFLGGAAAITASNKKFPEAIAAALAYHDIGLWTDNKLGYLEPSAQRANDDLKATGTFTPELLQLVHDIIVWHHKVTDFAGPNADIVNAVRKADWIDASLGVIIQGMPRKNIAAVSAAIPNAGFHTALASLFPRIRGWNFPLALYEFSSIFKW